MAAPRFAAVLRLREQAEEAARRELGRAEGVRRQAEDARNELEAGLRAARSAPVDPAWRTTLAVYEQHQGGLIAGAAVKLAEATAQADGRRIALAAAMTEVKAIRVLVERHSREQRIRDQRREDRDAADRAAGALIQAAANEPAEPGADP